MATRVQSAIGNTAFVRRAIQVDGAVSTASAILFILGAGALSSWVGVETPVLILFGIITLIYGGSLLFFSINRPLDRRLPTAAVVLNTVSAILGIALLAADPLTLTDAGKWIMLILVDVLGLFAVWQYIGLRRMR